MHQNPGGLSAAEIHTERKEQQRRRRNSLLLVVPILLFLFFAFVAPISSMLHRSIYNPTLVELIPDTINALSSWDRTGTPKPETLRTFSIELQQLAKQRESGRLASAVNRSYPGATSLINATARKLRNVDPNQLAQTGHLALLDTDPRWSETKLWQAIDRLGAKYRIDNYLTALDLERDAQGNIQKRQSSNIYIDLYSKTLSMSLIITLLCIALGYPVAYCLAHAPARIAGVLLVMVLLPFWTSFLVRTTAWIALLQTNGVINSVLQSVGIIHQPLELLYTPLATILAMTHILLPFMILPLYSVMKGIDPSHVKAALSLGSPPFSAFVRVYLPQTVPGLSAGSLLVFITAVGYYIIPALVGGTEGQMISNIIAYHMQQSNNWGLASALGSLLLAVIVILYWLYDRLVGASNLKLS
ncbi:ABC transporter permease [Neopusillimonas maritima]|uniref:ABC transporter permease n=1 Tax=Neopusillimonas maritima TaxID=2026239 RepID=A0ABX9MVJ8_9BURK|nr:ABC transporter permease [Neopusillimonas maritima]RII82036.1 ABC transporter permease [Neopusillimonas maritima]